MTSCGALAFPCRPWIVLLIGLAVACTPLTDTGLSAQRAEGSVEKPAAAQASPETVAKAQSLLDALGYHPGEADGLAGTRTRSAVRAFQKAVGLEPDGRVDDALVRRLAAERQKRLVEQAQKALASLGYDPGPADGREGPRTRTAVAAFQEAAGLPRDGHVTRALLDELKQDDAPTRADSEPAATPSSAEAPAAFVRSASHILAPGDRVRINIAGDEPFSVEAQVGPDGMVWLPRLGSVRAAGLRLPKLEEQIAVKLLDHYLQRLDVKAAMQQETQPPQGDSAREEQPQESPAQEGSPDGAR